MFVAVWLPYFGQRFPYTQVADDIQQLLLTNHKALDQLLSTRLEYFGCQARNQDTPNVQKPKKDWCTEPTDPDKDSSTSKICFAKSVEIIIISLDKEALSCSGGVWGDLLRKHDWKKNWTLKAESVY